VPSLDDTDLAAEVAARVPGVIDVVDEMTVRS
jgi:osmotically-inducible protein OsmY